MRVALGLVTTTPPVTGSSPSQPDAVSVGDALGDRYRLLRRIGRGTSATVYEARDQTLERGVAVKVLHLKLSADAAFLERFRNEARAAAALSHPNVMAVHDWDEGDSGPYLVTELLAGGSLRAMLDEGVVLSPSQTIGLGLQACRGLHYAHGEGLVHRDITPANLLFDEQGRLRIADFGLAKAIAAAGWTSQGTNLVGTARYASPEQASGQRLGAKSDVYSLGLILVEALSGSAPFSADTLLGTLTARVESDVPMPEAPERLQVVLRAMTSRDPASRPTAEQAGVALLKAAEGLPRPMPLSLVGLPEQEPQQALSTTAEPLADSAQDPDATQLLDPDQTQVGGAPVVVEDEDPVRRWPWLLVSVALIAIAGWFGYQEFFNQGASTVALPDVVGLSSDDAAAELGDTWILDQKFERTVDVGVGEVIMTDPVAGTQVAEGDVVSYWISLGRPLVRVPVSDLIGRSQAQVEASIEALDLTVGEVTRVNSEDVGEGSVIAVDAAASELQQGESVNLVVSAGPQDRVIPDVTGIDAEMFVETLEAARIIVDQSRTFDDDVDVNEFVSIDPAPGTAVERGSTVTVVISDGPFPVPIPPTAGLLLGEALDQLDAAGFLAGELLGSANAACDVVGTDPPTGAEIQPGTSIAVILSDCA